MVGGFISTIPAVQAHSLHTRRVGRLRLSICTSTIIMLLLHAALIHQAAVSAASPAVSMGMKSRTSNESQKLGLRRLNSQSRPSHNLPTMIRLTRFHHRRMLARRDGAIGASDSADQAMRALVGSSPPKCIKKCGKCTPCKSVLVPIHTTNSPATPAEYYPEAWRCQCKGKLYNP
ncbi:hypothetical protein GOP47_0019676 [Adiantum capillus-veneris]|uniref:Epidermal patterning factor-like protein n=1 Tax=Adiantum capillus-veneris TaxID=13818 RepID=A0A9D4UD75_ADICA|nr:hypothetical protein GOP47_0031039 [Adiantum capillus-veneris]KAI5064981.1 hypothetical protein GOP47_0019676 [Adiantum capillus-veneris]